MPTYGQELRENVGGSIQLTADGQPQMKAGGVSIDWSTVAAVAGADVTYEDGVLVRIGEKALRYGQVITKITASGKYGPYDPAAGDGRQTLARGDAYLINQTVKETDLHSDHPQAMDGGRVFKSRIIQSGGAAASLAAGPTLANLETTFPRIAYVPD